jgi:hypothetical protein
MEDKEQNPLADVELSGQATLASTPTKGAYDDLKADVQIREWRLVTEANLSGEPLKAIQDRLYRMIDYAIKRHDWYVDQCHRLLQIGLALMATGGAIAAIFIKIENLAALTQYLAWIEALCLFATGLILVYLYNNSLAGDHPYRKVVNIRSWFYKYLFSDELSPQISSSPERAKRQVAQEADFITKFFDSFLTHSKDGSNLLREDVEQVAILLILQRYRAQQVKKMANYLWRGVLAATVIFVGLGASFLFVHPHKSLNPVQTTIDSAHAPAPPNTSMPAKPAAIDVPKPQPDVPGVTP